MLLWERSEENPNTNVATRTSIAKTTCRSRERPTKKDGVILVRPGKKCLLHDCRDSCFGILSSPVDPAISYEQQEVLWLPAGLQHVSSSNTIQRCQGPLSPYPPNHKKSKNIAQTLQNPNPDVQYVRIYPYTCLVQTSLHKKSV